MNSTPDRPVKRRPLKLFFCYAHENADVRQALDRHLDILEREGLVTTWYDGAIVPGTYWSDAIEENLRGADIVVLLVSKAFLDSRYIAEVEIRMALELHAARLSVPVPVLVEEVPEYEDLPLARFESLPYKAKPIADWDDPVRAVDDVVAGIRRAAMGLLLDSGGAFDPAPHYFTDAELVSLDPPERARTLAGLARLRPALVNEVPRRLKDNLLVANWCLNRFGRRAPRGEALFYMAQILSAFDVISLQEIDRRLESLRALLEIMGPEWGYFITDITEGTLGSNERFAILHYQPRVSFEHISGEVVLPDDLLIDGRQFARKPLLAGFRAADFRFRMCAAHIHYGSGNPKPGIRECETLARFLKRVAGRDGENIILAGNFNIRSADSPAVQAFRDEGFAVPPEHIHPTSAFRPHGYYDMVGLLVNASGAVTIGRSGSFLPFGHVLRESDIDTYAHAVSGGGIPQVDTFRRWRTEQLSDHLPLWLELKFAES
jgi:endonuclease/exonuclease/phosphatase family metal-dependent hydrolase